MQRLHLILLLCFLEILSYSQEFSFSLIITDANGIQDSVTLGYDINATDSIDLEFGEENIAMLPWSGDVEMRAGEAKEDWDWTWHSSFPNYQSKKQIIKKSCNFYDKLNLLINCKNFPITITWNPNQFLGDSCRLASQLSGMWNFGWDYSSPDQYVFLSPDFALYTSDNMIIDSIGAANSHYWLEYEGNKIIVLWITFANPITLPPLGIDETKNSEYFQLYPNPGSNQLFVRPCNTTVIFELMNFNGQQVIESFIGTENNTINTESLKPGIYFYKLMDSKNQNIEYGKWIKK